MDVLQIDVCPPSVAAMVLCGVWTLWFGRNARCHGWKVWEPGAMVRYISSLLEDMASLKLSMKQQRATISSVRRRPDEC
jgi:hypothetical protein